MSNTHASIQAGSCCEPTATHQDRSEWSYVPAIDVYELNDAFVIECDAPGLKSDGISITVERNVLHLHGEVSKRPGDGATYLRQEYGIGDFGRAIPLGRLAEFVDPGKAEAEYALGVLTIRIPKLEAAQPRRIEVRRGVA
jgi:HSP20 family protein